MTITTDNILSLILSGSPVQALSADDWDAGLKLAATLGVTPLLYRELVMRPSGPPPPAEVVAQLRSVYYRCHVANAHLFHELAGVLAGMEQAGIPVILLKGAYLAEAVYRNPGLRPMGDLDILVPRGDVLLAMEVLKVVGYLPYRDFWPEVELPLVKHLPPFSKNGTFIELHWAVVDPGSLVQVDIEGVWSRVQPVKGADMKVLTLCPEDLVLHLCIHAAHHYFFQQLRSLCDIHEVIGFYTQTLDWGEIVARAKAWNAARGVYLALRLAQEILNACVPGEILDALCPPSFSPEVIAWAKARVFQNTPVLSDNFFAVMRGDPGKSRLEAFLQAMLPSPFDMSRIYGLAPDSWRVYLKYPGHWLDRISHYKGSAGKMLRGDARLEDEARAQQCLMDWLDH
jgi:hypothetical protein